MPPTDGEDTPSFPGPTPGRPELARGFVVAALALLAALFVALRWRWLDVPLERDEGEYAYGGMLLLEGVPPYVGLYNMKLPGIYAVYAAILAVGGASVRAVHLGLTLADLASLFALFLLARRLFDATVGLAAALLLATALLLPSVQGSSANAEHFVLPFALAGLAVLARAGPLGTGAPGTRRLLGGGALLGLALLTKQHGALLAAGGLGALLLGSPEAAWRERLRACAWAGAGVVLPYLVTLAAYAAAGHLADFWLWTAQYAVRYAQQAPLDEGLGQLASRSRAIAEDAPALALAAVLGLVLLALPCAVRARWRFLLPFALGSAAAIAPGLYFRPHYFVLLLPAAALLGAAALHTVFRGRRALALGAAALVAASPLALDRAWFFELSPDETSRRLYYTNPFVESVEVGRYLAQHAAPSERLAVLGSEPQLYVYSGLRGATGFVYAYALMEDHEFARAMQEQMIAEIEAARPEWLVFVRHPVSWLRRPSSETLVFEWFEGAVRDYELVARLAMTPGGSRLVEGPDLGRMRVPPPPGMDVFRRREGR